MTMLFPHHMLPRSRPRSVFLSVIDAGDGAVHLRCPRCGHDQGWVQGLTITESRRQPCPKCTGANHDRPA